MNLKKTLIIGVIFLTMLGYIMYVENPAEKSEEDAKLLLPGSSKEKIQEISLQNQSGSFTLKHADVNEATDTWVIDRLGYNVADPGATNAIVSSLLSFKIENSIPAEEAEKDLSVYGLKSPELTLSFTESGNKNSVLFGKKNEFTAKRYAKISDSDKIFFVTEELYTAANKSLNDVRDKTPIEFVDSDVATIKINSSKKDYELKATEGGKWRSEKPVEASLNSAAVSEVLRNIRNLTATSFYDPTEKSEPNPKDFGLDKPYGTVTLEYKESLKKEPLVVSFGNKKKDGKDEFFSVSGVNSYFSLAADPAPQIFRDIDVLREKNLFAFSADEVLEASFEIPGKENLKLERVSDDKKTTWKVDGTEGDRTFCEGLMRDVSSVKAESFPEQSVDFGFDKPAMKVVIKLKATPESVRTLVIGSKITEGKAVRGYYAGVDDFKEPFVISEATLARITPKKDALIPTKKTEDTSAAKS